MNAIRTLRFRLLLGSSLLVLTLFGIYSYFAVGFHRSEMMDQVMESATRISDLLKSSTHYSMLLNRKQDVYQIIHTVGRLQGVIGIRMYNKRGEITFSTDSVEIGSVVNLTAEACVACHNTNEPLQSLPTANRQRVYRSPEGLPMLGLINPIRNEASCMRSGCHEGPEARTVLGVLDVRMSLEPVETSIAGAERQMIVVAVILLAVVVGTSTWFLKSTVLDPVESLMNGTKEIGAGNFAHRIDVRSNTEIGRLAESFNAMAEAVHREQDENQTWARTLEQRVKEKTDQLTTIHQQIAQVEKMASLGKLAATVAHELNNPLEGILTYAKIVARRLDRNGGNVAQARSNLEDLEVVVRETQRCGDIVKNLLLFSRQQVGEFGLQPIRPIVDRAAKLIRHHCEISNVTFDVQESSPGLSMVCDEHQIEQALVALFVNAVEAMPVGGILTVVIGEDENHNRTLAVRDSGVGIPPENFERIFEPFFSTKGAVHGVGLGLSVVYGIVEAHSGRISVTSAVGTGTSFVMTFPPIDGPSSGSRHAQASTDP